MPVHLSGCRGENKETSDMQVYGTSKIYLIMATKALNEKLKGTGVEVFAAHPGRGPILAHPPAADHMLEICRLSSMPDKDYTRRLQ